MPLREARSTAKAEKNACDNLLCLVTPASGTFLSKEMFENTAVCRYSASMPNRWTENAFGIGPALIPGICPGPYLLVVNAVELGQDDLHTMSLLLHSASQRRDNVAHAAHLQLASACSQALLGRDLGCSNCSMGHGTWAWKPPRAQYLGRVTSVDGGKDSSEVRRST